MYTHRLNVKPNKSSVNSSKCCQTKLTCVELCSSSAVTIIAIIAIVVIIIIRIIVSLEGVVDRVGEHVGASKICSVCVKKEKETEELKKEIIKKNKENREHMQGPRSG